MTDEIGTEHAASVNQADNIQLAALGSTFLWAYAVCSPFAGVLADRYSRGKIVAFSLGGWSIATVAAAFARTANELLLTRVALGIAESAYLPAAVALIGSFHSPESRARAIGCHAAALTAGLVLGGAGGGYAGGAYGWRAPLLVLGLIGTCLAAAAWFFLRDPDLTDAPVTGPWFEGLRELTQYPSYWIVLAEAMIVSIGTWIFTNWLPLYFNETHGLNLAAAGFAGTAVLQGASTAGTLIGGAISDRATRGGLARRMAVQSAAYFLAAPFLLGFVAGLPLGALYAAIALFGFVRSAGWVNDNPMICDLFGVRRRSAALALSNTFNCAAGGIGVLASGYLKASLSLGGIFAAISVVMVVAAFLDLAGYLFFIKRDLARSAVA